MKQSKYNFYYKIKNKHFLFNALSKGLILLNENNYNNLKHNKFSEMNQEDIKMLKDSDYLIEDDEDELKEYKYLYLKNQYNIQSLVITVAPTMNCNFSCPYCFEKREINLMNKEVQDSLIKYIYKKIKLNKIKKLVITWYGGEPLMAKDIINDISTKILKIIKENNIEYYSNIITNGYLIDDETVLNFKKNLISSAQITIDGPPKIHNQRRILHNKKPTFEKIIDNVKKLIKNNIEVFIRVNVDETNYMYIFDLLKILKENYLEKCYISLGFVKPYTNQCETIKQYCLNEKKYRHIEYRFYSQLEKMGFQKTYELNIYGTPNYCTSVKENSFVIDPNGYMYRCWNNVGKKEKSFDNILNNQDENKKINNEQLKYSLYNPLSFKKCINCKGLPICRGGCPYEKIEKDIFDCKDYKTIIKNYILSQITNFDL